MDASRTRRALLLPLAAVFAALMLLYSAVWMYGVRHNEATAFLGVESRQRSEKGQGDAEKAVHGEALNQPQAE